MLTQYDTSLANYFWFSFLYYPFLIRSDFNYPYVSWSLSDFSCTHSLFLPWWLPVSISFYCVMAASSDWVFPARRTKRVTMLFQCGPLLLHFIGVGGPPSGGSVPCCHVCALVFVERMTPLHFRVGWRHAFQIQLILWATGHMRGDLRPPRALHGMLPASLRRCPMPL